MRHDRADGGNMTDYTKLESEVDAIEGAIWDLASKVWEFAEVGFEETQSSAYASALLEKHGFTISDRGIGGLNTSWIATWGSGSRSIGIESPRRIDQEREFS